MASFPNDFLNDSNILLKEFYDASDAPSGQEAPAPGEFPFTRGLRPDGYRKRPWTMRQYAGFGTASETNERFKYLLSTGQTGLSTAFDLPTQIGLDSDDPQAEGEVGKVGVAIDSLADMEEAFQGIPLDKISTSMTINATAPILLAMYQVVGEKQGVSSGKLTGTTQNDILKEYVARGTYIYPPQPSFRLCVDLIEYCAQHLPRFNPISISGYHIRDAGSTAVQEMAFTLSNAIAYVEGVLARGVDIDDFAPRISWIFNTHNDFFQEVAKYRALRKMWAVLVRDRWGAKDERSCWFRTHIQTGGSACAAQQPENNIVRAALQALASVLGGVQSMALSCYDEALAIPTPFSQEIALRTQQVIAEETGITKVTDPLGGSYYIEYLTQELEGRALELMKRVERMGGAIRAIESGFMGREIEEASYQYQKEIESGQRAVVGVNRYEATVKEGSKEGHGIFRVDPALEAAQHKRLKQIRGERDGGTVATALRRLADEARGTGNLLPAIVESVGVYATVGEISAAMREVFGVYKQTA